VKLGPGAERAFSLLRILFGSNQDTALSEYIRVSIMLRYAVQTTPLSRMGTNGNGW
jgi:hypothetical protein